MASGSDKEPDWLRLLRTLASDAGSSKGRCCTDLDAESETLRVVAGTGWLGVLGDATTGPALSGPQLPGPIAMGVEGGLGVPALPSVGVDAKSPVAPLLALLLPAPLVLWLAPRVPDPELSPAAVVARPETAKLRFELSNPANGSRSHAPARRRKA